MVVLDETCIKARQRQARRLAEVRSRLRACNRRRVSLSVTVCETVVGGLFVILLQSVLRLPHLISQTPNLLAFYSLEIKREGYQIRYSITGWWCGGRERPKQGEAELSCRVGNSLCSLEYQAEQCLFTTTLLHSAPSQDT